MSNRQRLTKASMGIRDGLPLEASAGGVEELRKDVQRLMDMEAIRQLKHAYFRCIDSANFEELATLFHEEVSVHFIGGTYEWKLQGREDYMEAVRKSFHTEAIGHHNGHHPEIQMLSESEATGVWYLADNMWILSGNFFTTGTALYWDRYLKVDGRWVIRETKYERLYEITRQLDENPPLTSHYLAQHGSRA
ncbi:MAG: nuclear transport factor 2 family protein [Deltaproteobacteria bacterium]|nr:nuclear transport factor 2 family protein [Deltaproteobacteria bacterium]MBW2360914.1 nuclear transport factor 2 family protein [Deltaproteobacteria bacterium]